MQHNKYQVKEYSNVVFEGSHKECVAYIVNLPEDEQLSLGIYIVDGKGLNVEEEALYRYNNGEKHGVSTFIDEDTIIAGYGGLNYDFEFPLPVSKIKELYGTTSWSKYFELNPVIH